MKKRRQYDSSKTRASPLLDLASRKAGWVKAVVEMAEGGVRSTSRALADPKRADCYWSPRERALHPPLALLEWLIKNLEAPSGGRWGPESAAARRKLLAARDRETIEAALQELRRRSKGRGWHILEGASYPDGLVEGEDYVLVAEGKRTETRATATTTWLRRRHQLLRHMDAAWELRNGRVVVGLLIVEGPTDGSVPSKWRDYSREVVARSAMESSLPHRSADEQRQIVSGYAGVLTWQRLAKRFGTDPATLPRTTNDVEEWRRRAGIGNPATESSFA
jgi:hypothetical protein